jgi:small subunit ribosomal protein S9
MVNTTTKSAKGGSASGGKTESKPKAAAKKRAPAHAKTTVMVSDGVVPKKTVAPVLVEGTYIAAIGRRKEATARVRLIAGGKGTIVINARSFENYFPVEWQRQSILSPLIAVGQQDSYDISVKVEGGGMNGQADSVRHGIARALLLIDENYRKTLRRAGYLTRDPRAKERKKPGLKRARKRGQWAKR